MYDPTNDMYDAKSVNGMVPQPPASKMDFSTFDSPLDFNASGVSFDDQGGRFVAGEQFYNHEMYGSLRKGGAVDFLSMECLGLVAATFTSMLSYQALLVLVQPMYNTQLGLNSAEVIAVERLIQMPMALSFLVGLLSDCYPIMGLRRKGYMILGCVINAVAVFAIAGVSAYLGSDSTASKGMVVLALILVAMASIGCIITYVCVHTRVIEYSQRESLRDRGAIQVSYLIFRRFVSIFTSVLSFLALGTGSEPNISVSTAMIILGVISVLPLPLVFRYWNEDVYSLNTSMKIRSQILWKIMQQKAVWRILAFIWFFTLFLGIKFSDSTAVVSKWAGASGDNSLLVKTIQDFVMIGIMLVWRYLFINRLWPIFFALAPAFQILPNLFVSLMVALDIARDRFFYRVFYSMTYVSDGIGLLNTIVPVTEIVQEGSEGALVGLTLTLQRCVNIFVDTNAHGVFQGTNYYSAADVAADTSGARWDVLLSLFLNYALNALAWVGLFFLPSQKLDAQQLRMYGGFTKGASFAILAFCLVLFIYSFVVTLMSFIPSTSCLTLVGGSGC
uniref:Transmembrane protein n=1 Tax=Phytophthora ramorum TaxID=164328 RepID=H3GJI5_PHYRM